MFRLNTYSATILGFCLATSVTPLAAQSGTNIEVEFVPLVQPCIDAPGVETCAEVRAVIRECAEELEPASCDVLFTDPDAVFDEPAMRLAAQEALLEASDAMPEFPVLETDGLSPETLDAARADAERTMLRGDENQMTHSQPEIQEGTLDDESRDIVEEGDTPAQDDTDTP